MNQPAASMDDRRLVVSLAGTLLLALALAGLLVVPHAHGAHAVGPPGRFLGLDEPVQPVPMR
jgi:hypothetical protein